MADSTITESNDQLKNETKDSDVDQQKVKDSKDEIQWFTTMSVAIVMVSAFVLLIALYMYFFPTMTAVSPLSSGGPGWWDRLTGWMRSSSTTPAAPANYPPLPAAPANPPAAAAPFAAEPPILPPPISILPPPVNPAVGGPSGPVALGQGPLPATMPPSAPPQLAGPSVTFGSQNPITAPTTTTTNP